MPYSTIPHAQSLLRETIHINHAQIMPSILNHSFYVFFVPLHAYVSHILPFFSIWLAPLVTASLCNCAVLNAVRICNQTPGVFMQLRTTHSHSHSLSPGVFFLAFLTEIITLLITGQFPFSSPLSPFLKLNLTNFFLLYFFTSYFCSIIPHLFTLLFFIFSPYFFTLFFYSTFVLYFLLYFFIPYFFCLLYTSPSPRD